MDTSVYDLFGLTPKATPHEILHRCQKYCSEWAKDSIRSSLSQSQPFAESTVNAEKVHYYGEKYLKTAAAMLLDPSAKQCYDAWLDACSNPSPEKKALTRSRLLWFNQTNTSIRFDDSMIDQLQSNERKAVPEPRRTVSMTSRPKCRCCRLEFDFSEDYLVLHCHCTTRVGHVSCMSDFSKQVNGKCPVCRQTLLRRHQVSKYLFWNVKEKYKFV